MARPIPEKVSRLVPLLASDIDGEAIATVRAIGRVLSAAGMGFGDLAEAIDRTAPSIPDNWLAEAIRRTKEETPGPPKKVSYRISWAFARKEELEDDDRRFLARLMAAGPHSGSYAEVILTYEQRGHLEAIIDRLEAPKPTQPKKTRRKAKEAAHG